MSRGVIIEPDENGLYGGVIIYGPDGVTPISSTNPLNVSLTGSNTGSSHVVNITTTNTAQQLPSFACHMVTVIAKKGNSGTVYVGLDNTVTATDYGDALDPKDSQDFGVSNLNQLWIYGAQGDGVSYVAV